MVWLGGAGPAWARQGMARLGVARHGRGMAGGEPLPGYSEQGWAPGEACRCIEASLVREMEGGPVPHAGFVQRRPASVVHDDQKRDALMQALSDCRSSRGGLGFGEAVY